MPADLDLEVDQLDADAKEHAREEIVHPQRQRHDIVQILLAGPAECDDIFLGDEGVAQLVVLEAVFDDRDAAGACPLSMPSRLAIEPAAKFRTITSSGMIST